jgi:hypothetical protein
VGLSGCAAFDLTPAEIAKYREAVKQSFPDAREIRPPTHKYNCVGYALARSHGWFNCYRPFFTDDYNEASFDSPRKGDVVEYRREGVFMHVAVVTRVENGRITRVRSKWSYYAELSHRPEDVSDYGKPTIVRRPRPGVVPFTLLEDDEDMSETAEAAPIEAARGGVEMPEFKSTEEAISGALERISDPMVLFRAGLASTPEAARVIIEGLPGVGELIEIGLEAAPAILLFLKRAEEQREREMISIALYLLQRIQVEEAKKPLAESLIDGKYTGINLPLAVDAFLTIAGVEIINENPTTAALRAAEKIKLQE